MTELTPAQRAVATFGLPPTADSAIAHPPDTSEPGPSELDTIEPDTIELDTIELDTIELDELTAWAETERLDGLLWDALVAGRIRTPRSDGRAGTEMRAEMEEDLEEGRAEGREEGRAEDQEEDQEEDREDDRDGARAAHLSGLRSSLAAEATGVAAVAALARSGIEPILFKGVANAHLDYDRPEQRTFFDADLLVGRDEFAAAVEVLVAAGFTRTTPPLRERWERRFARAIELRSPDGAELDVHASLATGYFGEILDHDALRNDARTEAGASTVHLAGVDHRCFGPAGRLLISSYAIVLSRGPGIRLVRDLAQQLLVTGADWQRAARLAGDGGSVLAAALLETARQLGIHHDAVEWARTVTPSPAAARALAYARDAQHQGWSADARSTMLALGPVERIRFLGGVVLPSRANLRSRGRTFTSHLSRSRVSGPSAGSSTRAPSQVQDHER